MPRAKSRVDVILSLKNNMAGGLSKATLSLNKLSSSAKKFGMIGAAATGVFALGMGKIMQETAKLDDALRNLSAKLGENFNGKEFKALEKEIRDLGRTTTFTTTQVAQLATVLAQGGKNVQEVKLITKEFLHLSRAMSEDTADAARIAQSAMDGFGLSITDAKRAADVLAYTVNNSNQNLIDLGEANNYVATTARDAGMSIERVSAMLAVMANNGIRGSRAGVQLRAAFLQLSTRGKEVAEALDIDLVDSSGKFRDFGEVLVEFRKATEDMTDVRKFEVFKKAFGKVGISAALILGRTKKELDEFTKELNESFGMAEEASKDMDAGIGGAFRYLYAAAEEFWLALGNEFAPQVKKLADEIKKLITSAKLAGFVTKIRDGINNLLPKLGKLTAILLTVGHGLSVMATGLAAALLGVNAVAASVTTLGATAGFATKGIQKLGRTIQTVQTLGNNSLSKKLTEGMTKGYDGVTKAIGKTSAATRKLIKHQMTSGAVHKRAASIAKARVKNEAAAALKMMKMNNLRSSVKAANAKFGTNITARQVAAIPNMLRTGQRTGTRVPTSVGGSFGQKFVTDKFTGAKRLVSSTGGIPNLAATNLGGVARATDKTPAALAQARSAFQGKNFLGGKALQAQSLVKSNALVDAGKKMGSTLVKNVNTAVSTGIKSTPRVLAAGLKNSFNVAKIYKGLLSVGPQVIAMTLVEGVLVGVTGSEAQASYNLMSDFMSGAIFTGLAKGMKAGGAHIASGLKEAFEFAQNGEWTEAWESIKLSISLGFREMMDNMSEGVKGFVTALNNFKSGSFVTFLRTIFRGFTTLASVIGDTIDGIVYISTLGFVKNATGADIFQHLDDMTEYDRQLQKQKGTGFFHSNEKELAALKKEKAARAELLAQAKARTKAKEDEKSKALSLATRVKKHEMDMERYRQAILSKKKKSLADAAQAEIKRLQEAGEAKRQQDIKSAQEKLKQLGIIARVEADAESGRESAKFSRMSQATRKITREGIGGLGGEGVMRQFAEKQNDVHKQNLDSQHRQESELRQINVQLKKYALESLLIKP